MITLVNMLTKITMFSEAKIAVIIVKNRTFNALRLIWLHIYVLGKLHKTTTNLIFWSTDLQSL